MTKSITNKNLSGHKVTLEEVSCKTQTSTLTEQKIAAYFKNNIENKKKRNKTCFSFVNNAK